MNRPRPFLLVPVLVVAASSLLALDRSEPAAAGGGFCPLPAGPARLAATTGLGGATLGGAGVARGQTEPAEPDREPSNAPPGDPQAEDPLGYVVDLEDLDDPSVVAAGRELYTVGCVSCHGADGSGIECPDLRRAGTASAHFFITSGRMPAEEDGQAQSQRKRSPYTPEEIEALVAYVGTLGEGPDIPIVEPSEGDLQEGGELFRLNCAACHQAGGAGGALSYGHNAPSLAPVTPVQVADAIRVGPGQMPVFSELTDHEVNSIVRYVTYLQGLESPGGFSLGRVGPVPEGLVAFLGGVGGLVLFMLWTGKRRTQGNDREAVAGTLEPAP